MPKTTGNSSVVSFIDAKEKFDAGAYDDVWSETRRLKIRGSLNKALKVYRAVIGPSAAQFLTCDVAEHDRLFRPFIKSKRAPEGCGFRTFTAFKSWASNIRAFHDVASGRRAAIKAVTESTDDWSELLAHLSGRRGVPAQFNSYELIPLLTLARECRLRGIALADVSAERIAEFAQGLPGRTKASIRRGCVRLDSLQGGNQAYAPLLPRRRIGPLSQMAPPEVRRVPPLHPDFSSRLEKYIKDRLEGRSQVSFGTETRTLRLDGVSDDRAKNIRDAIRWYWHGLVVLGLADATGPLDHETLTHPAVLHDVVAACATGRLGPVCAPETRRARTQSVVAFLETLSARYRDTIPEEFYRDRALHPAKGSESPKRADMRRACLEFIHDRDAQHRFFTMPARFHPEATRLIDRFSNIDRVGGRYISKDHHVALDLAIMAALTAIITRFPARVKTLSKLEAGGPYPHLLFPETGSRRESAVLNIPGHIVKGGYFASGVPLLPSRSVNPRRILSWYLRKAHPLVLKYKLTHDRLRMPERLFCGLSTDTIRNIWRRYAPDAGVHVTAHMCRHLIASLMFSQGLSIDLIAELLGHRDVATTVKQYTFIDRTMQIQGAMDEMAQTFRELGI